MVKGLQRHFVRAGGLKGFVDDILRAAQDDIGVGIQGAVEPGDKSLPELVQVALQNEFGTPRIPSRPFLRTSLRTNRKKWTQALIKHLRLAGQGDAAGSHLTIRRLGVVMVSDVQRMIRSGSWAPNAPLTIALKGSSRPLVDTGQLVQSIRAATFRNGRQTELLG